jgi:hypothetical protein
MSDPNNIRYVPNDKIDKTKWDDCITRSTNGLIYGYSFYLDHMARNWDALVMNDYEAVMPLPRNKKWTINYIYQPFLTAQSGVFNSPGSKVSAFDFLNAIPAKFKFIDISLNSANSIESSGIESSQRSNYILNLNRSYQDLWQSYRENIQRNIKKCFQQGCTVQKDFDSEKIITLAIDQMKDQGQEINNNIDLFRNLYKELHDRKMATTYGIFSDNNQLLASSVFFFSHKRAYYILVGNHPESKNSGASHALVDAFIKDHAGKDLLLDFEGSDIPSLAHFYSGFGAEHETYPAIKINRLPFYVKWMKK